MRSIGWLAAAGALLLACQGHGTGPAHALALHVSGSGGGQIHSSSPAFSCATRCDQEIGSGSVRLSAVPDPGSAFTGWQGACSGTADCDLAMSGDRDVTAVFDVRLTQQPANARVSVILIGTGSGRVSSAPAGIDCPGACSIAVQAGSNLSLAAQAGSSSSFTGWGGGCSGPGGCSVVAGGDLTVWAEFTGPASSPPTPQPLPAVCAGLAADPPRTPVTASTFTPGTCDRGMVEATGAIGLQRHGTGRIVFDVVDPATGRQRGVADLAAVGGSFAPQSAGFTGIIQGASGVNQLVAQFWDSDGKYVSAGPAMQGKPSIGYPQVAFGILLAGDFSWNGWPARHQAWLLNTGGAFQWGHDLAAAGAVVGLGADSTGKTLIVTVGAGIGNVTAQWFDSAGVPLTGEFVILTGFEAGQNTWFETAPLIGGGVALRRVDQQNDADGRSYRTSQWLLTLAPGQTTTQAAPQWLAGRSNTDLASARSGKAYAVLPLGGPGADCAQKIDVLAPDGTGCGSFDATIARGQCRTEDVSIGREGTPIQLMPKALTPASTCSYRWWPAALR